MPRTSIRHALRAATAIALAGLVAGPSAAQSNSAGRTKAQLCAACHGPLGIAAMPNTPNLAGQPEQYLVEQLKAYRSGKRAHEIMSLIAKPLTDDEIAAVSAWYASLKVQVSEAP